MRSTKSRRLERPKKAEVFVAVDEVRLGAAAGSAIPLNLERVRDEAVEAKASR